MVHNSSDFHKSKFLLQYNKENYDQYWKDCAEAGSPKNDELLKKYTKEIELSI